MTAAAQPLSDECEQTFDAAPGLATAGVADLDRRHIFL